MGIYRILIKKDATLSEVIEFLNGNRFIVEKDDRSFDKLKNWDFIELEELGEK